jgi:hypothetical protein
MTDWTPPGLDTPATDSFTPPGLDAPPGLDVQPSKDGEFIKGVHRGLAETKAALSFLPDVGEAEINKMSPLFDKDKIKQDALDYKSKIDAANKQYPAATPEMSDINGIGSGAKYLAGQAGEMAPGMAAAFIPGLGAGEVAGSMVAKDAAMAAANKIAQEAAMKAAGETAVESLAANEGVQLSKEAGQKFIQRMGTAGAAVGMGAQSIPAMYANLLNQGVDAPGTAILAGATTAGLMTIVPGMAIGKVLGPELGSKVLGSNLLNKIGIKNTLLQKVISHGVVGAAEQGALGATAEAVNILAEHEVGLNPDMYTKENLSRVTNAGMQNALAGAMFSSALAPFHGKGEETSNPFYGNRDKEAKTYVPLKTEDFTPPDRSSNTKPLPPTSEAPPTPLSKEEQEYMVLQRISQKQALPPESQARMDLLGKILDAKKPEAEKTTTSPLIPDGLGSNVVDPKITEGLKSAGMDPEQLQHASPEDLKHVAEVMDFFSNVGENHKNNLTEYFATGHSNLPPEAAENVDPDILRKIPIMDQARLEAIYDKNQGPAKFQKVAENPYHLTDEDLHRLKYVNNTDKFKVEMTDKAKALGHDGIVYPDGTKTVFDGAKFKVGDEGAYSGSAQDKPVFNNLQDVVDFHKIASNMEGTQYTGTGDTLKNKIVDSLQRIMRESGVGTTQGLRFWDSLRDRIDKSPIAGAHFMNMIHVALNDSTSFHQAHETLFHEIWHAMERSGLISPKEIALFDSNTHLLKDYMMRDAHMSKEDFDELRKTPLGREELRANAFGKMMQERNAFGYDTAPSFFKTYFNKIRNMLLKFGAALRGQNVGKLEDFVKSAIGSDIKQVHADTMFQIADARFKKLQNQTHVQAAKDADQAFKDAQDEFKLHGGTELGAKMIARSEAAQNAITLVTGTKGMNTQMLALITPRNLASKSPYFQLVYNHFLNLKAKTANYSNTMHQALDDWKKASPEIRGQTGALMAKMRELGLKGVMDHDGVMSFRNESGDTIHRLFDKDQGPEANQAINRAYESLQRTMQLEHSLKEQAVKTRAYDQFKDVLLGKDFTLQEAEDLKAQFSDENGNYKENDVVKEQRYNDLSSLIDNLKNSELMKKHEYIPFSHIGDFGYTVKQQVIDPKTGRKSWQHVAQHNIEAGHGNQMYNEFQREREVKKIASLYSDTSKYRVFGQDAKNPITNFSDWRNVHPFAMTYNNMRSMMDPRLMNATLWANMVHSTHMDIEAQAKMKADLGAALDSQGALQGFGRMFKPSENLKGYSTDWDRVLHRQISGTSHLLSSWDHVQERANLQASTATLLDKNLKAHTEAFMKYVGSPSDDFNTLRTFNYMWAMGGNFSSMLVQLSTLPTMTLGQLCKYNPHVLQNMRTIGKWMKIASIYYAKGHDQAARESLVKSGRITVEQANVLRRAEMENQLMSVSKQDMQSKGAYERESDRGSLRANMDSLTNLMARPVFIGEQMTRFATFMGAHEIMQRPEVEARMRKVHANDHAFQGQLATKNHLSFAENAGRYIMDTAHGVYGREGRVNIYRGLGGSLIFPFMTFPHAAIERMIGELRSQGAEGRVALAVTLGSLAMVSGLMGLPGATAATKLYDEYQLKMNGIEGIGAERMIYEKIAGLTGSTTAAKLATYGVGRAFLGTDIGRRFGLPELPGQDVIFNALGIGGQNPAAGYGVEGSVIGSVQRAFEHFQQDDGPASILGSLLPGGIGNVFKATDMAQNGVESGGQRTQMIITPAQISLGSILQKLAGATSDQVSSLKENFYAQKAMSGGKMYQNAWSKYTEQGGRIVEKMILAQQAGDVEGVKEYQQDLKDLSTTAMIFAKDHNTVLPPAFMKSIYNTGLQRVTGATAKPNKLLMQQSKDVKQNSGY